MKTSNILALIAIATLAWAGGVEAAGAHGETGRAISIDIPAQSLGEALTEFGKQTGLQVVLYTSSGKEATTTRLTGTFTPRAALERLLKHTGLRYEYLDARTVAILAESDTAAPSGARSNKDMDRMANWNGAEDAQAASEIMRRVGDAGAQSQSAGSDAAAENSADKIQEIIVTAQKREERLQDVPISIAVLGGSDLDRSTTPDLTELLGRVPGVSFTPVFAGGTSMVAVRGVAPSGSLLAGAATTAYYLDAVSFGFVKQAIAPDPDVYDLERVEVLRGPQGTLYGASALNGVVRVLTKDADLDEFELKARGSTSSSKDGGMNYRGDMAVNVPLIEGKLAARAVLGYQNWGGWIDRAHKKDANDAESRNLRLKVNAQPTEQLSIGLSAWRSRDDFDQSQTGEESGRSSGANDEPASTDYDTYGLKVGYDFPGFSLTSTTGYLDYENSLILDLTPFGVPGGDDVARFQAQTFTQEVILQSSRGEFWRWSLGGMYRDTRDRYWEDYVGLFPAPAIERNQSKSHAVFGELSRLFLNGQWEFTAGLRYFKDEVTQTEESRLDGAPPEQLALAAKADTFSDTSKRFVLTWRPTQQANVYASYAEGFRSGAHQSSQILLADQNFPSVEPDKLKNYELGVKHTLPGGRLSYDAALYFIDWQNPQRTLGVLVGGFPNAAAVNSVSASGLGADAGVTIRPSDALELSASFGWNDLTYDEDEVRPAFIAGQKGDRLPRSPEYTGGVSADYLFPLAGLEGRFSVAANYTSGTTGQCRVDLPCLKSDDILLARTSFSIRGRERWTGTLFVDNLNNEEGVPVRGELAQFNIRLRPRTIGVQFEYRY